MDSFILRKSSEFVFDLFKNNLPLCHVYHNFKHTEEVVETTENICNAININEHEKEALLLAAWFHDVGFIDSIENHEERSSDIALKFLFKNNYTKDGIEIVKRCILVTNIAHQPENLLEEIIRDADISHIGKDSFFYRNDLLRSEWETCGGKIFNELQWLNSTYRFFINHPFYTEYAKSEFEVQRKQNLHKLEEMIKVEENK